MKTKSLSALAATLFLAASGATQAQDAQLSFTCDLGGAPAQMRMAVEYINSHGINTSSNGDISGVFPVGSLVYVTGQLISETARYSFEGENQFADFSAMDWHERFRVKWILDANRNGLWVAVNPFGHTTYHFCEFDGFTG